MSIDEINLSEIQIKDRARVVDPNWVEMLAGLIAEQGLIHPIRLWKDGDGVVWLVAGMHRMEAHKLLQRDTVPYTFSLAKTWDDARLEEVLENLGRNELTALDRAQHLFELKRVYEKLYPEAKNGGDRKSDAAKENQNEIISFRSDAAQKIGLSERSIELAVKLWKGLSKNTRTSVQGTSLANHQAGLFALASVGAKMQAKILDVVYDENLAPKSVPDAIEYIENGKLKTSEQRQIASALKSFKKMPDTVFGMVMASQRERVLKWAKEQGEI